MLRQEGGSLPGITLNANQESPFHWEAYKKVYLHNDKIQHD